MALQTCHTSSSFYVRRWADEICPAICINHYQDHGNNMYLLCYIALLAMSLLVLLYHNGMYIWRIVGLHNTLFSKVWKASILLFLCKTVGTALNSFAQDQASVNQTLPTTCNVTRTSDDQARRQSGTHGPYGHKKARRSKYRGLKEWRERRSKLRALKALLAMAHREMQCLLKLHQTAPTAALKKKLECSRLKRDALLKEFEKDSGVESATAGRAVEVEEQEWYLFSINVFYLLAYKLSKQKKSKEPTRIPSLAGSEVLRMMVGSIRNELLHRTYIKGQGIDWNKISWKDVNSLMLWVSDNINELSTAPGATQSSDVQLSGAVHVAYQVPKLELQSYRPCPINIGSKDTKEASAIPRWFELCQGPASNILGDGNSWHVLKQLNAAQMQKARKQPVVSVAAPVKMAAKSATRTRPVDVFKHKSVDCTASNMEPIVPNSADSWIHEPPDKLVRAELLVISESAYHWQDPAISGNKQGAASKSIAPLGNRSSTGRGSGQGFRHMLARTFCKSGQGLTSSASNATDDNHYRVALCFRVRPDEPALPKQELSGIILCQPNSVSSIKGGSSEGESRTSFSSQSRGAMALATMLFVIVASVMVPWLLVACGDVEQNPGPDDEERVYVTTVETPDATKFPNANQLSDPNIKWVAQPFDNHNVSAFLRSIRASEAHLHTKNTELGVYLWSKITAKTLQDVKDGSYILAVEASPPPVAGTLWDAVSNFQAGQEGVERKPDRHSRMTGDMAEWLAILYPIHRWKQGKVSEPSQRTMSLKTQDQLRSLGHHMKWVGRAQETTKARTGMLRIMEHSAQSKLAFRDPDIEKEGTYRVAFVGAPGTGKTAMTRRVCQDVAALPTRDQNDVELQRRLLSGIAKKLHYRMDLSSEGNGRLTEEKNGKIRPEQSLALRVLYMFCREDGQSFQSFITQLINTNTDNLELVARVLAQLELRDVIQAACAAFQLSEDDPTSFCFTLDECQSGFEPDPEKHQELGSTVAWFRAMMSSQAFNLHYMKHLVLFLLAGTHMDIASVTSLSSSGMSITHHVALSLLARQEVLEILEDLCRRLDLPWRSTHGLLQLANFCGGNLRQLECLLAAAASVRSGIASDDGTRLGVFISDLMKVFDANFEFAPAMWDRAVEYLDRRQKVKASLDRWVKYQDGALIKFVLGQAMSGGTVKRGDHITPTVNPATVNMIIDDETPRLTYGSCESSGVLTLDPVQHEARDDDVINQQEYYVRQPPMVFRRWLRHVQHGLEWFAGPPCPFLNAPPTHKLEPMQKEVVDATSIIWKMVALRKLLGRPTCKLGELLPCVEGELKEYKDIDIQLPDKGFWNLRDLSGRESTMQFRREYFPEALENDDETMVFMGQGKDPAPDWFIILHTMDGRIILLQGQSKCHDKDEMEVDMNLVDEEYKKRLKNLYRCGDPAKVIPVFVFATDATVKRVGKQRPDVVILDRPKRLMCYNPFGAVMREYYQKDRKRKAEDMM